MNRKTWYIVGGAVALVVIIAAYLVFMSPSKAVNSDILTGEAAKGDISKTITATGVIQPDSYNLSFKNPGIRIAKINVAVGDRVEQGKVLVEGDVSTLKYQLDQSKAGLDSAKIRLDQAGDDHESKVRAAKEKLVNAQENYDNRLTAAKEKLDQAQLVYQPMLEAPEVFPRQEIAQQELAVESARNAYETAKENTSALGACVSIHSQMTNSHKWHKL